MLKRLSITFVAMAVLFAAKAQSTGVVAICDSINNSGHIAIDQSEALAQILRCESVAADGDDAGATPEPRHIAPSNQRTGYRVQVFDDNNPRTSRSQAEGVHRRIQEEFPHMRSYISFNSPYWRVKAGDFRTRAEAEAAMAEIKAVMPGLASHLRVVRDKINVF